MLTVYDITAILKTFIAEHPEEFPDTTWYDKQISVLNSIFCDIEDAIVSAVWKYKFTVEERRKFILDYYVYPPMFDYESALTGDFIPDQLPLTPIFSKLFNC